MSGKTPSFKNVNDLGSNTNQGGAPGSEAGNSPASDTQNANTNPEPKASTEPVPAVHPLATIPTEPPKPESVLVQELIRAFKSIGEQQAESKNSNAELISALGSFFKDSKNRGGSDGVVLSPDEVAAQYSKSDVLDSPVMFFRICGNRWVDMGGPGADGSLRFPPFRDQYNRPVPMIWEPGPTIDGGFGLKGERIVTRFAQYVCKSQKELDYIKGHRDFGTVILENAINQGHAINSLLMSMNNASKKVNQMSPVDRVMFARDRNIDVDNLSPQEWYKQLVFSMAEEETREHSITLGSAKTMFDSLMQTIEHPGSRGVSHAGITNVNGREGVLAIHRTVDMSQA